MHSFLDLLHLQNMNDSLQVNLSTLAGHKREPLLHLKPTVSHFEISLKQTLMKVIIRKWELSPDSTFYFYSERK